MDIQDQSWFSITMIALHMCLTNYTVSQHPCFKFSYVCDFCEMVKFSGRTLV